MYAKLFSRITESSLMEQPIEVRYVFLMFIAIADPCGIAVGTDIAIARRMNVSLETFKSCVEALMKPDPDSNSQELEGRRVVRNEGERGYFVVNYPLYRGLKDEAHRKVYMAEYMRNYRANKAKDVNSVNSGKPCKPPLAQSESESESESDLLCRDCDDKKPENGKINDARVVIHFLNEQTGRHFRELQTNLSIIEARLKEPGVTLDGVKAMVTRQCLRWKGTEQEEYLRPETLFGKTKFDGYYAARDIPIASKSGTSTGNLTTEAKIREIQQIVKRATV